jgi:hypothetical protein
MKCELQFIHVPARCPGAGELVEPRAHLTFGAEKLSASSRKNITITLIDFGVR